MGSSSCLYCFPAIVPSVMFLLSGLLCAVIFLGINITHGVSHYHTSVFGGASFRASLNNFERIAVCFSGNSRTFRLPVVHENLVQNVILPLRTEYIVDVYFIISLDDVPRSNRSRGVVDQVAVEDAVSKFNPVHINYVTSQENVESLRRANVQHHHHEWLEPPTNCSLQNSAAPRIPYTLLRSKQCLQHISEFENRHQIEYDWVYRLRPDTIFLDEIITPHSLRNDVYYSNQARINVTQRTGKYWLASHGTRGDGAVADQVGFSSRKIADIALRAWDATDDCELYRMGFPASPEDTLRFWLMKNNMRYEAVPFDWAIVRENVGPECKRLFHQHGVSPHGKPANWKISLKRCFDFSLEHQQLFPFMINVTRFLSRLPDMQRFFNEIITI